MKFNITTVRKVGDKLVAINDKALDLDVLSIGSDGDRNLFLDDVYVIANHAEIVLRNNTLFIIAVDGKNNCDISVNNRLVQKKKLKKGDVLNFGSFEVTVLDINSDLSKVDLQVEKKTDGIPVTRALSSRKSLSLESTWLKKRSWSIKGFSLLLVFFLLIPLFGYFMPSSVSETLRNLPIIPSDNSWESGELAYAHHIDKIGNDCNSCHQKPFIRVEDTSCANSTCHKQIKEHIDPELYAKNNYKQERCGSCHKEHNGTDNNLIDSNDRLCFSCHHPASHPVGDDKKAQDDKKLGSPAIIDLDVSHPEFRISMHKLNRETMTFNIERASLENLASLKEESNLKFPHDKHLVYKGVENKTTGKTVKMTCDSCHTPALAGDGFKPVTRKKHCQDCHLLTFEPEFPDDSEKQVPHGNVTDVIDFLTGYYSDRALKDERGKGKIAETIAKSTANEAGDTSPAQRFRPGSSTSLNVSALSDEQRINIHKWVEKKVDIASKEVFNFTTCTLCHEVIENQHNKPAWSIVPVRINEPWLPKANLFNHKKHAAEKCNSCHDKAVREGGVTDASTDSNIDASTDSNASLDKSDENKIISKDETRLTSSDSSDILMPKLSKCKECHTSKTIANKNKTSCVTCHGFHTDKKHLMSQGESQDD